MNQEKTTVKKTIVEMTESSIKPTTREDHAATVIAMHKSGKWTQLKKDIIKYNEMREKVVQEMENQTDPVFQHFLKEYKSNMSAEEFDLNCLKIYAICNKQAMCNRLSVDEMVNMMNILQPPPPPPS